MVKIYKQPFAHDGDTIAIPDASQPDGKMSSTDGWTPDYQLPKTDPNYKPVGRQEMNGVFKEVTEALGQMQVQGAASWSANGAPYPINAQVYHNGKRWMALRANSVEPAEGEYWTKFSIEPGPDLYSLFSINNELVWRPTRRFLTAPLTLYISPTGDDANLGTDKTNPKKTLESALKYLRYIDSAGYAVSIVALPGTYGADGDIRILDLSSLPFGTVIRSESDNPKNTVFRGRLTCTNSGTLTIRGIGFLFDNIAGETLVNPGVLRVVNGGTVAIDNCEVTNGAGNLSVYCSGSLVNFYTKMIVTATKTAHSAFFINIGGTIYCHDLSMTITGDYSFAVAGLEDGATLSFTAASTIAGPANGKRYSVMGNSLINTRGGGANYIPGSIAGTTATGGQYV